MNKSVWDETKRMLKPGDYVEVSYLRMGLPQKRKMEISKVLEKGISFLSNPSEGKKFYVNFQVIEEVKKVERTGLEVY